MRGPRSTPPGLPAPLPLLLPLLLLAAGCGQDHASDPGPAALGGVEAALAEGHYGGARRDLAAIDPAALGSREARVRLARAAVKARDFALAARALEKDAAGGRVEGNEEAQLLRIEGLIRSGGLARAQVELAEMERGGRKPERWKVLFALAALARGERGVLESILRPLVERGSRDVDAHLQWAGEAETIPELAQKRLYAALGAVADEDRPVILKALGRLLLGRGEARRAAEHLEKAVEKRPWDRDARLDLVRAWRRIPDFAALDRAVAEARRMLAEEPSDMEVRLALAEVLAQRGELLVRASGGNPGAGQEALEESIRLYEQMGAAGLPGGRLGMQILLGAARAHAGLVRVDDDPGAADSHLSRALALLDRAESLDPEGRIPGEGGLPLISEVHYLRGRAWKLSHLGMKDNTEAIGWYEKAVASSGRRHLEATWDLGLLYVDFMRTHEWLRKALSLWERHIAQRQARGLPPLDEARLLMVQQVRRLVEAGVDLEPGVLLEDAVRALPRERPPAPREPGGEPEVE